MASVVLVKKFYFSSSYSKVSLLDLIEVLVIVKLLKLTMFSYSYSYTLFTLRV